MNLSSMKLLALASLILGAAVGGNAYGAALTPGIYRIDATSNLTAVLRTEVGPGKRIEERFEHAFPAAAGVTYAVVSRDARYAEPERNRVLFLTADGYKAETELGDRACIAYALPGWNYYSAAEPFCSGEDTLSDRTLASFILRLPPRRRDLDGIHIPPVRTPTQDDRVGCLLGVCDPAAYGKSIERVEVTYRTDRFTLEKVRPYLDIVFLENAVPIFASRERTNNRSELKARTFVAVLDRQSEWFEVDYFEHGNARHGWIDRDDVVPVQWLAQRAATRDFRFRVGVVPGDSDTDAPQPVAIEVLSRHSGQRLQVLRDFESDGRYVLGEEAIDVIDANFDGHPDIAIDGMSGGAGPNSTTNVFLYDPAGRQFRFSRELSELTQLWIDPTTQTVHSAQRGSCCSHYSEVYRYVRGKLTLVSSKDEYTNGEWVSITTGRLRNGKMYYRETRRRSAGD
ncbi:conserved exported protein of unknown function [Cupriavidus taiwanensis]|uniref:FG-GAP repeat protein n=2 Tax=Cupriavidus taiwanensis TaxID=164546 RepID=A0A7Z7NJB9_9BURK|nr:conserved exported protein of unknown function [Cupriavidus taiwanensis]SOY99748.1 conserved exported hypothetical protein [Cupriavidus taiwanensis]SOZ02790.1 conserved exported hypothetical protein [Cupriavidus taiwanensis]SPC06157.1 conserved exported hypothetical protein [Cupriavidus taiwanensis]SPD38189.1 conserved exported protein of unknown function [Cupriavidus taiwanensis]